jgi:hypothetical protein
MAPSSYDLIVQYLDTVLPISHVLITARTFLADCAWQLEIDESLIPIPTDTELVVRARAFVKADTQESFSMIISKRSS